MEAFTGSLPVGTYTLTVEPAPSRYLPLATQVSIATDTLTTIDLLVSGVTVIYLPQVSRSTVPLP